MSTLTLAATDRAPAVEFDFAGNVFALSGESFPEDTNTFFGPLVERLETHLRGLSGASVRFVFALIYFNSSTAKVLMELFDLLDATAAAGNSVTIVWAYEEGDDSVLEIGEEFSEDLQHAHFAFEELRHAG